MHMSRLLGAKSYRHTCTVGYNTSSMNPKDQPHFTAAGNGSENCPLLHFAMTRNSVMTVANNNQTCWPILTAFLVKDVDIIINECRKEDKPWVINILEQLSDGWEGAEEDEGQAKNDDGVIRFQPQETLRNQKKQVQRKDRVTYLQVERV